jgi:class 3 adenylate cyclase
MGQRTDLTMPGDLTITAEDSVRCVVLFVDIRDSTEMLESPRDTQLQELNIALCETATSTIESARAPAPTFAKSTGDGLMLLWELGTQRIPRNNGRNNNATKRKITKIIEFSLALSRELKGDNKVRKGIGLAIGNMTPVGSKSFPSLNDYIGWAANYAAKLQDVARPHGVVIDRCVVNESSVNANRLNLRLKWFATLRVRDNADKGAYATEEVRGGTQWTCLAWPGFATAEDSTSPLALNTKGLGVVTHEGISGKIDRLTIWDRRWRQGQSGDKIEVLIDDLDAIQALSARDSKPRDQDLKLLGSSTEDHEVYLSKVCADIRRLEHDFLFIPIRCGLNALLTRSKLFKRKPQTYVSAVHQVLKQSPPTGSSPLGLYDHIGTSVPLLVQIGREQASLDNSKKGVLPNSKNVFSVTNSGLDDAKKGLESLAKLRSSGKLFRLYPRIRPIIDDLAEQDSTLMVVIGGGRWLCAKNTKEIKVIIPSKEVGYLWVEGAAFFADNFERKQRPNLAAFLVEKLLAPDAQAALRLTSESVPYPACPVTKEAIKLALTNGFRKKAGTDKDVKLIFNSSAESFLDSIKPREVPTELKEWRNFWEMAKVEFCAPA